MVTAADGDIVVMLPAAATEWPLAPGSRAPRLSCSRGHFSPVGGGRGGRVQPMLARPSQELASSCFRIW